MTINSNSDDTKLRDNYLANSTSSSSNQPALDEVVIKAVVKQANAQVGMRDLVILSVSSFFAFLMIVLAPLARSILTARSDLTKYKDPPES